MKYVFSGEQALSQETDSFWIINDYKAKILLLKIFGSVKYFPWRAAVLTICILMESVNKNVNLLVNSPLPSLACPATVRRQHIWILNYL